MPPGCGIDIGINSAGHQLARAPKTGAGERATLKSRWGDIRSPGDIAMTTTGIIVV